MSTEPGAGQIEDYSAVVGVSLNEPVSLREDVQLLPWTQVPDSYQKKCFGQRDKATLESFHTDRVLPTAAIRIVTEELQVLYASHEDVPDSRRKSPGRLKKTAWDVVQCVTVAAIASPRIIGSWEMYGNPYVQDGSGMSYSYSPSTIYDSALVPNPPPVVDAKTLTRVFRSFERFNERDKPVLRVGIDRLSAAFRLGGWTNKAIDLGIALEVFLLHNLKDQGELTYRLALRGSGLLGGTHRERLESFKALKKAYKLRSRAVHSGRLDGDDTSICQALDEAARLCSQIACKLIERGSFPADWEDEYVIGSRN